MCKMHPTVILPLFKSDEFETFIAVLQFLLLAIESFTKLVISAIVNMIAPSRSLQPMNISKQIKE